MKQLHIKRLEKLARHLEKGKLGHKKFRFDVINCDSKGRALDEPKCGYAGCAMGELPIAFPKDWQWSDVTTDPCLIGAFYGLSEAVEKFFGIGHAESSHLFYPVEQEPERFGGEILQEDATKEEVAANIRAFIKRKKTKTP